MKNEAEELLIAWRKTHPPPNSYDWPKEFQALVRHADKLIAEREPKIMSAEEMCGRYERYGWASLREALLTNIAAVLDKKLADAETDSMTHSFNKARRIVADTLKDPKP